MVIVNHRWRNQGGPWPPQILLVMLLAPSDYVPFNKCKDFFAANERKKNYFGTFQIIVVVNFKVCEISEISWPPRDF